MAPSSLDDLLITARRAADAACAVHRKHAGRVAVADAAEKGTSDFVSRVDVEAQQAALAVIRERHPDHGILAEEEGEEEAAGKGPAGAHFAHTAADAGAPVWIVDPLDGTTNFLNGHPMYCASVAVCEGGAVDGAGRALLVPVAGAVSCAPTGERWWAARGKGAYRNGRPIRTSPLRRLGQALIGTGFPFKALDELPAYLTEMSRVLPATAGIRRGGAAALDLCYLAQGTFDGFWERHLKAWDVAAGIVIVEEAGGRVTRLDGSTMDLDDGGVLGANSEEMLEALGRVVRGE